jgi:hypothetical protein
MRLTPDSSYPVILLPEPVVVVQEFSTDRVTVLRVIEELIEPKVTVEFMVEGESIPRSCVVLEGENYFADWDDQTIADAIGTYLIAIG